MSNEAQKRRGLEPIPSPPPTLFGYNFSERSYYSGDDFTFSGGTFYLSPSLLYRLKRSEAPQEVVDAMADAAFKWSKEQTERFRELSQLWDKLEGGDNAS